MRFLRLLLGYGIFGLVMIWLLAWGLMYFFSFWQGLGVSQAMSMARQLSVRPQHSADCMSGVGEVEQSGILGYQLVFVNDTDYRVEAVCADVLKGSVVIREERLGFGVKKEPGYAGAFFASALSESEEIALDEVAVVLGFGMARWSLRPESVSVQMRPFWPGVRAPAAGRNQATTSCEGWGYQCCDSRTQAGVGEVLSVVDRACVGGCYRACLMRPSILSFTTSPVMDLTSRTLELVGRSAAVLFSYSVQVEDGKMVRVSIDYGDEAYGYSTNLSDQFSHTYECSRPRCTFLARLMVEDSEGLSHAETRIDEVLVVMRP